MDEALMNAEADGEMSCLNLSVKLDSEDSDEESSLEEPLVTSWTDLSIVERVGLNSVEMSDKDLETAFSQITLAFRCDQYTLKQRLQAEEHARNLAEENIQLELSRGRETLEMLKSLCLDSNRSHILQRLELSLDILGGTVERVSNTAEVLGAVHQEARVSRAVELMVAHVESLKRRSDKNVVELEETKKIIQQQKNSRNTNPRSTSDPEDSDSGGKSSQKATLRRRISASVITSQTQEKKKRESKKRVSSSKKPTPSGPSPPMNSESNGSAAAKEGRCPVTERELNPVPAETSAPAAPEPAPAPNPESPPAEQVAPKITQNKTPPDTLRQRHKGKEALSNKGKEKRAANIQRQISMGMCGCCTQQPPPPRVHRGRWIRVCLNLFVLFCVIVLTFVLWKLYEGDLEY
ncbi:inositol 1,4,5-triphosphate receptor associated 2 isoform X2 [Cololabis saira]|uniref:inositol 1,4,5-triphosphate receptor associated 2 isoform X2 n=1 Tax=Cololabis saira TaxID=129043 RepID=UPI002AD57519|nr:inositol 1,4,5-triphosphate receptor associated 2 isoform X2 [Cololabis saira]